ncbi:regucalcin [Simiduia agarivorans SA1 = DSM 21679]|uniref:Regucalcin n=2 Tax=Simiduia TaxID=447467 RepID=K4KQX1_SIMAS|nr:regucalcin [Simiduia agarivorans SA1 = DSM 21679]
MDEVSVHNGLGECVLWDEHTGKLLWTDMPGKVFYRYQVQTQALESFSLPEDLCSFAMIERSPWLLAAFQSGLAKYLPETGEIRWFWKLPEGKKLRMNDGRCDAAGRFWVGSLIDREHCYSDDPEEQGGLYCVAPDGTVSQHLHNVRLSNSICWSPDSRILYFSDSTKKCIEAFAFDLENGTLGAGRSLINLPPHCNPDGSVTDSEGHLWNALWGSSQLVRISPAGKISDRLQLPVSQPACPTFAGPSHNWLVTSSATYSLSEEALAAEPGAGNLFIYETAYTGKPEYRFKDQLPV